MTEKEMINACECIGRTSRLLMSWSDYFAGKHSDNLARYAISCAKIHDQLSHFIMDGSSYKEEK